MKGYLTYFYCLVLFAISNQLTAETLKVAVYVVPNPPYSIIEEQQRTGIFVDLFKKLEQVTEHKFTFVTLPVARAIRKFDAGDIDIEPGVNEAWRQHTKVLGNYSIAYAQSEDVVVFNKKPAFPVTSPIDLYGKKVGIVRGFTYPKFDPAFSEEKIIKIDNLSEKYLLKQLLLGRLDQIFIGYRTVLYYMKRYPEYQHLIIGDFISKVDVKIRIHPNKAHLLPDINAGLQKMITNGDIESIYNKYK